MNPIITEMTSGKGQKAFIQGNPSVCEYGENETIAIAKLLLRLQGKKIVTISGAFLLAVGMWISWIALTWLFLMDVVQRSAFPVMMWAVFFVIGVLSSAYATRK